MLVQPVFEVAVNTNVEFEAYVWFLFCTLMRFAVAFVPGFLNDAAVIWQLRGVAETCVVAVDVKPPLSVTVRLTVKGLPTALEKTWLALVAVLPAVPSPQLQL
jgi:hypothetical protein